MHKYMARPAFTHQLIMTRRSTDRQVVTRFDDTEPPVRVLIVDDHIVLAQALAIALRQEQIRVEVALDFKEAAILEFAEHFQPDVVLLDLFLTPSRTTLPVIRPLIELGAKVVVITASDQPIEMAACLDAGAIAVLPKSEALGASVDAVRRVVSGEPVRLRHSEDLRAAGRAGKADQKVLLAPFERLTAREGDVLSAIIEGWRAEEIASEMGLAVRTVRTHLEAIRSKLGVSSQIAAVALARQAGWTSRP